MALKTFKPTTPSNRYRTVADFSDLTPKKAQPSRPRKLTKALETSFGRNNLGRITSFRKGGGHKKKYRVIDFMRNKVGVEGKIVSIEYDPNRTARIALVCYLDGEKRFIVAPIGMKIGDKVLASPQADIQPGNSLPLSLIPVGT